MHFLQVLLPVFMIFCTGYAGQKLIGFDIRSISVLALYLMTPFLVFRAFYQQTLGVDFAYYIVYAVALMLALIALVSVISRWRRYTASDRAALVLSSAFMNSGNYGIPVVWLAFGEDKAPLAVIISVIVQLLMNTVGFWYAARGSTVEVNPGLGRVWRQLLRQPVLYCVAAGLGCQLLGVTLSAPLMRAVGMVADASVVVVMITLGMQLATIRFHHMDWPRIGLSMALKLLASPLLAVLIVWWMPLPLIDRKILILLAAMPTAAITTLLAVQFNTRPDLVSSVTFFSTIASLVTLSIVLGVLALI